MAARLTLRQTEQTRAAIQTSQLVNRLQKDALGEIELTAGQRKSIEILLRKTVPDLQAVTISGDEENPLSVVLTGLGASVDSKIGRLIGGSASDPAKPTD